MNVNIQSIDKARGRNLKRCHEGVVRGVRRKPEKNGDSELKGGEFQREVSGQ